MARKSTRRRDGTSYLSEQFSFLFRGFTGKRSDLLLAVHEEYLESVLHL